MDRDDGERDGLYIFQRRMGFSAAFEGSQSYWKQVGI